MKTYLDGKCCLSKVKSFTGLFFFILPLKFLTFKVKNRTKKKIPLQSIILIKSNCFISHQFSDNVSLFELLLHLRWTVDWMPHISYFLWRRFLCWTWIFGLVNRILKCNIAKMSQMKHFHLSKNETGAMRRSAQRWSMLNCAWKGFKIFWFGKTTVLFLSVDKNCQKIITDQKD